MSHKPSIPARLPSSSNLPGRRKPPTRLRSLGTSNGGPEQPTARRGSISGLASAPKAQRTSKTSHKLVVLPSAPQTRALPTDVEEDLTLAAETDGGVREYKSEAERMSKEQRKQAGYKRITAYCVAESFKMKLLASFLKREHNVSPRVFDEALYVMYHLPLLPGYGPNTNVRSSAPATLIKGQSLLSRLSEAEENGYQGTYFTSTSARSPSSLRDGYISSTSPVEVPKFHRPDSPTTSQATPPSPATIVPVFRERESEPLLTPASEFAPEVVGPPVDIESGAETDPGVYGRWRSARETPEPVAPMRSVEDDVVEVVFFEYGVVVFFGLEERFEKDIIEDVEKAGVMKRRIDEDDWKVEECHFAHDPHIAYPRIYNDFFTLKSRSHLLKLSIAHALAQSTLLARYETTAQQVLSSPLTISIPKQLAKSGVLKLRRHEALKLTGRLFKLRRDVNLVSNVLDIPELFWSEASLKSLYDAVREYMEIKPRVQLLNEKLGVVSDFLDAIHDHLNNSAMERITWIIIWLIVVAILVELGEVIARLVVHATLGGERLRIREAAVSVLSKEEALRRLEGMIW